MDRPTFLLIQLAAHYAERFLKLDPVSWLNTYQMRVEVIVAIKGHHLKPELQGRPTLSAQAIFGLHHRNRFQEEHPLTENSDDFRKLVAQWGGVLIKKQPKASKVQSHQPKKTLDVPNLFSVGASGGNQPENSAASNSFTKAMNIFLAKFKEEAGDGYDEGKIRDFSEKMKVRLTRVRKINNPNAKGLGEGKLVKA